MTEEHTDGWVQIDRLILAGESGVALASIRQWGAPMDIGEAIEIFDERYAHLRATRPDDFTMAFDGDGPDVFG